MGRARIEEADYYQFLKRFRAAAGSDGRIEPSDKQRWKAYVRDHNVKEASCMSYARRRTEKVKAAILVSGGPWDGYYVYSSEDEFCLKFVPGDSAAAPASETPEKPAASETGEPGGVGSSDAAAGAPGTEAGETPADDANDDTAPKPPE